MRIPNTRTAHSAHCSNGFVHCFTGCAWRKRNLSNRAGKRSAQPREAHHQDRHIRRFLSGILKNMGKSGAS